MKWVLIILGVIAAIAAIVVVIGLLLPEKHVASRKAVIRQSPETIWSALTTIREFPSWRSDLTSVELLPERDGHPLWIEHGSNGDITMERMEAVPMQRLVGRIADSSLAFGGRWIYELRPVEGGTEIAITEEGEVYNPFFRFMSRFIFGHASSLEDYLEDLGKKYGEKSQIVAGDRET